MRAHLPSASLLALASNVIAQTPNGTWPSTNANLGVDFASVVVKPGIAIVPNDVLDQPGIHSSERYPDTYMVFMLDLTIPDTDVTTANETSTLVDGIAPNRTTRLHWWTSNLKQTSNGSFVSAADGPAPYTAPRPRSGDIPHTYTQYLFKQPPYFQFSSEVFQGIYYSGLSSDRFNYTLAPIVDAAGAPLAANYFTKCPWEKDEIHRAVAVNKTFDPKEKALQALRLANDAEYGLMSGVFTKDIIRAKRVAKASDNHMLDEDMR